MNALWQDIRFAVRMLLKHPGVTLVAVVTLALGIGANTAIFSVINVVLLKPLPYPEAERIITLASTDTRRGQERGSVAAPEFAEWQKQHRVFEHVAAYHYASLTMAGAGEPERVVGSRVTADFMKALGVAPATGRDFLPDEDQPGGNSRVALISHGLWQRRFAADPQLLNQTITLNGETFTVVGIMPPGFGFPSSSTDVWLPANLSYVRQPGHVNGFLSVVARLKPNVSLVEAQTEMRDIAKRLGQEYDENKFRGVSVVPLYDVIVGEVRPSLIALFGAVCLVLLIACANIANLLLTRATARRKEIAIRTALGASRFRLICQMLTESILLALLGGGGGLLLAVWCTDLLTGVVSSTLPRAKEVAIDGQTLLFTLLVALLTGLLFGLAPAIQASKTNLNSTLKEGGRSQSSSLHRGRLSSLLVVTQIALSLVLLVSAGLFIKSFRQLRNVNPGFDPAGVATMHISLPRTGYAESRQKAVFFQQVLDRVATLPGVQSAGVVTNLPLGNSLTSSSFEIEGRPPPAPDESRTANKSIISHDYFRAMGIPLLKGRALSERDATDAPGVVVINQAMARRFFSDEDPLGKRLTSGGPEEKALYGEAVTREIVGIVGDVRFELEETAKPEMYIPYTQAPIATMALVARSGADPASLREPLRRAIQEVDRTQTGYSFKTMGQLLSESVAARQLVMMLTNIFAALALILAAVGIYGVIAYSVAQRTHELGIRIALGAQTADVLRLVVGQGMTLAILGVAVGLASAFVVTRFLSSLLYGVSATDAPVFIGTAALLGAVALLASYIPARRATKVDPLVALRHE